MWCVYTLLYMCACEHVLFCCRIDSRDYTVYWLFHILPAVSSAAMFWFSLFPPLMLLSTIYCRSVLKRYTVYIQFTNAKCAAFILSLYWWHRKPKFKANHMQLSPIFSFIVHFIPFITPVQHPNIRSPQPNLAFEYYSCMNHSKILIFQQLPRQEASLFCLKNGAHKWMKGLQRATVGC